MLRFGSMNRHEINTVLGWASFAVAVLSGIAAWLAIPGILETSSSVHSTSATASTPTSTTTADRKEQSQGTSTSEARPAIDEPPATHTGTATTTITSGPVTVNLDALEAWASVRTLKPKPKPTIRRDGLLLQSLGCSYIIGDDLLYCFAEITNEGKTKASTTVLCGARTTVVDNYGESFPAHRCFLGGDDGNNWASEALIPGVKYHLSAIFRETKYDGLRNLRHVEFGIGDGFGFGDVPVSREKQ